MESEGTWLLEVSWGFGRLGYLVGQNVDSDKAAVICKWKTVNLYLQWSSRRWEKLSADYGNLENTNVALEDMQNM